MKREPHRDERINCVYVLMDPRRPGERWSYWSFTNQPFYVGRTAAPERRYDYHMLVGDTSAKQSPIKIAIQRKIKREGLTVQWRILRSGLTIDEANELEKKLIALIGRRDLGRGPLANLTDGGDGCTTRAITKAHRAKVRATALSTFLPPHLELIASWSSVFKYINGYRGKHRDADYLCSIHGRISQIARETERAIAKGRAPCTACGIMLRKINVGRGRRGEELLRTTPANHRYLMNRLMSGLLIPNGF